MAVGVPRCAQDQALLSGGISDDPVALGRLARLSRGLDTANPSFTQSYTVWLLVQPGQYHGSKLACAVWSEVGFEGGRGGQGMVDGSDCRQSPAQLRAEARGRGQAAAVRCPKLLVRLWSALALEIVFTGQDEVGDGGEREYVRFWPDISTVREHLFGCGVSRGTDGNRAEGGREPHRTCKAEVGDLVDLGVARAAAQDVRGLHVAMQHTYGVDLGESPGHRVDGPGCARPIESIASVVDGIANSIL